MATTPVYIMMRMFDAFRLTYIVRGSLMATASQGLRFFRGPTVGHGLVAQEVHEAVWTSTTS